MRLGTLIGSLVLLSVLSCSDVSGTSRLKYELGGIELTMGTSQEEVFRQLGTVYELQYDAKNALWDVKCKSMQTLPIGGVEFENGRLTKISEFVNISCLEHVSFEMNAVKAFKLFIVAMQRVKKYSNNAPCVMLDIDTSDDATRQSFNCGRYQWTVTVTDDESFSLVQVSIPPTKK